MIEWFSRMRARFLRSEVRASDFVAPVAESAPAVTDEFAQWRPTALLRPDELAYLEALRRRSSTPIRSTLLVGGRVYFRDVLPQEIVSLILDDGWQLAQRGELETSVCAYSIALRHFVILDRSGNTVMARILQSIKLIKSKTGKESRNDSDFEELFRLYPESLSSQKLESSNQPNALANFEKDQQYLALLSARAFDNFSRGKLDSAMELFERVLPARLHLLGKENPDTLRSMHNLAATRLAKGDRAGARLLQEQVYEVSRRIFGEEHSNTLVSMNNLAATMGAQGDRAGARQLLEQVYQVQRRTQGLEHPDTLTSMNNIAATMQAQGDCSGARQLLERVYQVNRQVLGDEHVNTLASLDNLAATLNAPGDLNRVKVLEEQVLEVRRRTQGDEHPDTLKSMSNLAVTKNARGDFDGARRLRMQVLEVRRRVLGEEHPSTLMSMYDLGSTMFAQGLQAETLTEKEGYFSEARTQQLRLLEILGRYVGRSSVHFELSDNTIERLLSSARNGHIIDKSFWELFAALSRAMRTASDLMTSDGVTGESRAREVEQLHPHFVKLHENWLKLSIEQDRQEFVAPILATLQGRELTTGALQELDRLSSKYGDELVWREYSHVQVQLRQQVSLIDTLQGQTDQERAKYMEGMVLVAKAEQELEKLKQTSGGNSGPKLTGAQSRLKTDGLDGQKQLEELRNDLKAALLEIGRKIAKCESEKEQARAVFGSLEREYREKEKALQKRFPDYALVSSNHEITIESLGERLLPGEALAMLFELADQQDTPQGWALVISADSLGSVTGNLIQIPLVNACESTVRYAELLRSGHRGLRDRLPPEQTDVAFKATPSAKVATEAELALELKLIRIDLRSAWKKLRQEAPETTHSWHIVTMHRLHNLPLQSTAPEGVKVYRYPGLAFFLRPGQKHQSQPLQPEDLLVHRDLALGTRSPIPFVEVDTQLIQALIPGSRATKGVQTLSALKNKAPAVRWFATCAHGEHNNLVIQGAGGTDSETGKEQVIGLNGTGILALPHQLSLCFQGNCFGADVKEQMGRSPVGLVPAYMIRGAQLVLGSLMPIDDFWMPVFTGVWFERWMLTGDAHQALEQTKRSISDWELSDRLKDLIRQHYRPVMRERLESAATTPIGEAREEALVRIGYWPMDEQIKVHYQLTPVQKQSEQSKTGETSETEAQRAMAARAKAARARQHEAFIADICNHQTKSNVLVEQTIERLINLGMPAHTRTHFNTWFACFGGPTTQ